MSAKASEILSPDLARKISPWIVNSAQMTGLTGRIILTGVAVVFLYGPVGINPDHNGFLYLLGPWVCPALVALFWSVILARTRFRIYRGNPFAKHHYVQDDPVVTRLAKLFNSSEARRHLWWESLKLACILFAVLGIAAVYYRNSLEWSLPSSHNGFLGHSRPGEPGGWFWVGSFGCCMFTFWILISDYYRWCLMTWAKRESTSNIAK
jgi:hypothetical protein